MKILLLTVFLACSALIFSCQKEVTGSEQTIDPPTTPVVDDSAQLYKFVLVDISSSDTTDYTIFSYDNSGRIIKSTSYLGWPNPADSFITQYHYASVTDTIMSGYLQYRDGDTTKVFLQYDTQGRLIKDSLVDLPTPGFPGFSYTSRYSFTATNITRTTTQYINLTVPQHFDTTYSFPVFSNGNLVQQKDSSADFVRTIKFTYDTNPNRWIKGFPRVPVWNIGTHYELGILNGTGKNNLIKTETTDIYPTTTLHRIYSYRNRLYNGQNRITQADGFAIDNSSPEQTLQRELYYYR